MSIVITICQGGWMVENVVTSARFVFKTDEHEKMLKKIAEIKGMDFETVRLALVQNAARIFNRIGAAE